VNTLDALIARSQVWLSMITLFAFIGLIFALIFNQPAALGTHHDLVVGLTSSLGTVFTLQMNFWFARHRAGVPDPPLVPPPSPAAPAKVSP
jgi:hypothetical protein